MSGGSAARLWAAVPVKEWEGAKHRLAPILSPAQRRALAAAMLEDVLEVLARSGLAGIMVNTLDPEATRLALRYGARVVTDGARDGHTGAVTAMGRILAADRCSMLALPGDIPRVIPGEIDALREAHRRAPAFTIAPSRDEKGSNAVLVSPAEAVKLRFGEDSFFPHLAAARRHGIEPVVVKLPGIALDIDTPDDLRAFVGATPRLETRALRWLEAEGFGVDPSPIPSRKGRGDDSERFVAPPSLAEGGRGEG